MDNRIPPLLTPFAILSISLALGATNVVVNKVTATNEGTPSQTQTASQSSLSNKIYGSTTKTNKDSSSDDDADKSSTDKDSSSDKKDESSQDKDSSSDDSTATNKNSESQTTEDSSEPTTSTSKKKTNTNNTTKSKSSNSTNKSGTTTNSGKNPLLEPPLLRLQKAMTKLMGPRGLLERQGLNVQLILVPNKELQLMITTPKRQMIK
ncbi:hypothetical protein [Lentilactobacillus kosonis]|uniref:Extracellular protein n=1 Tax=Lentilactobacillus kosonis TaxID=2810561 RepID=A0A401FLW4_9LACO|nr:hypothetical protein [Lentilactobacillus kosonis]GAY73372.1 extracellular protein [Lentilactobacillus kosonis]